MLEMFEVCFFQQRTWFLWDKTHVIYDKAVILFGDGQGAENHQRWGRTNAWWELGSSGGLSWATVDGNGWAKQKRFVVGSQNREDLKSLQCCGVSGMIGTVVF